MLRINRIPSFSRHTRVLLARMENLTDNQTPTDSPKPMAPAPSEKRRAAGQRNGRLAAGTKSAEGLLSSAQNALKHGFYARQFCLLATESPSYFEKFRNAIFAELQPYTPQQYRVAQSLTQYSWLLERNFAMEVAAMDMEISSHKQSQATNGEMVRNQFTAWLAFDSLVNKNSSLTALYRQRTQIERQIARLRKEYASTISLRESAAHTSYIPPLPSSENPMFDDGPSDQNHEPASENCTNEGNGPEANGLEGNVPECEDAGVEYGANANCRNEGNGLPNNSTPDHTPRQ